ncbi:coiled-coil domain-containing protein 97 [Cephus cinctus]|uniref:Coiled-coil domain-containing protein 97 n=1 Tax=Cephus cinctus TaxID=211228 RepID=A0AAJ7FRF5_CEPCN|nr:coiled-coil domain-containing protein 97 [Cephus cinctus]XP_015604562.1 coiled-coil domain-containing protein 97 [Cephus cinctus]
MNSDSRSQSINDDLKTCQMQHSDDCLLLQSELLDYVATSNAIFKSQQKGDPELSFDEKRTIAAKILQKSHCIFLSRFGCFLKKEHLRYFEKAMASDHELTYHINRLHRYYNSSTRQIDIKNRRYQALKLLIEDGDYFSETEMMKRNPLLYEQLVGQYLTEDQKKARDNIDTTNVTFVSLLMEGIDKDGLRNLKKAQEDAEDNVVEENESDEEWDEEQSCIGRKGASELRWGEAIDAPMNLYRNAQKEKRMDMLWTRISNEERKMLKQEFVTNMYQSFLDGKDIDFDYSAVDDNEAYDNVGLRTQDEEEKYFDSESPKTVLPTNSKEHKITDLESEDELDAYMKSLEDK